MITHGYYPCLYIYPRIWGASADDVWVGVGWSLFHFAGSTWSAFEERGSSDIVLMGIGGTTSDDVWGVGYAERWPNKGRPWMAGSILHWNGADWTATCE